jgi:hypothetical protein
MVGAEAGEIVQGFCGGRFRQVRPKKQFDKNNWYPPNSGRGVCYAAHAAVAPVEKIKMAF